MLGLGLCCTEELVHCRLMIILSCYSDAEDGGGSDSPSPFLTSPLLLSGVSPLLTGPPPPRLCHPGGPSLLLTGLVNPKSHVSEEGPIFLAQGFMLFSSHWERKLPAAGGSDSHEACLWFLAVTFLVHKQARVCSTFSPPEQGLWCWNVGHFPSNG